MTFFQIYLFVLIGICAGSIPLNILEGDWTVSGMSVLKETGTLIHRYDTTHTTAKTTESHMTMYNKEKNATFSLYSINSTSFLFEAQTKQEDSLLFNYPFIFSVFPYSNLFFSSFQGWNNTWIDLVLTNHATTLTISAYTNNSITLIVAVKEIKDERSFLKRNYLLFLVGMYLLLFILPNYLLTSLKK
ncbi:hypothetical protein EIN_311730 [Entamoeba invadens IP1]|uniref:Uncharacterized protein n=1 Tax=Entamoeba invadens IP1 TaxID=370355 RepID=A0A0A1TX32_ENTIV|nr:hypothetical protein EIN_311730 [Entamoeba invadens IP1]ELP83912.1 hypothetical protein EIN_311730 [Entamoeba invadens IP1]|eukprot:XP_004183258.1 hypothetical protein EIN_311730 [Entamoeba invadens IP1]